MNNITTKAGDSTASAPPTPRVELRSHELINLFGRPIVHNEIVFIFDEKNIISLNGMAFDRRKGTAKSTSLSGNDFLQVVSNSNGLDIGKIVKTTTLYQGDIPKIFELFVAASQAAVQINEKNLPYIIIGMGSSVGQNSNSVAHTLMHVMDVVYPLTSKEVLVPGNGRLLMNKDELDKTLDGVKLESFHHAFSELATKSPGFLEIVLPNMFEKLKFKAIAERIKGLAQEQALSPKKDSGEKGILTTLVGSPSDTGGPVTESPKNPLNPDHKLEPAIH